MPKKTRKEKMASQLRRLKEAMKKAETTFSQPLTEPPKLKYNPTIPPKTPTAQTKSTDEFASIYKDIRQVGIVVVVTLLIQIGLNLTLRTNFAKLLLRSFGIEI